MLPRPGTMEQLEKYVARLHSSLLDRSRPLWEIYVIEGLHTGQVPGHGVALNITVQSYNGLLEVGLTACDVADLGDYIVAEHQKLRALIEAREPAAAAVAPAAAVSRALPTAAKKRPRIRALASTNANKIAPIAIGRRRAPPTARKGNTKIAAVAAR